MLFVHADSSNSPHSNSSSPAPVDDMPHFLPTPPLSSCASNNTTTHAFPSPYPTSTSPPQRYQSPPSPQAALNHADIASILSITSSSFFSQQHNQHQDSSPNFSLSSQSSDSHSLLIRTQQLAHMQHLRHHSLGSSSPSVAASSGISSFCSTANSSPATYPLELPSIQNDFAYQNNSKRQYHLLDFEFLETLGTGTFGRVHLSRLFNSEHYFAMKVLNKSEIVRLKQVEHINSEKSILSKIYHPFIVNLFCSFQDTINVFMLLEYVPGGELFSHLRKAGKFPNDVARFYAAEIITAIEYLHDRDIIYRDLKPENLLLDSRGHIKIADFGFAKIVKDRTWTLCGTPEYLAPEIIQGLGHGRAVDWWSLGILVYEMLCGYPPFFDDSAYGIYEKILAGRIYFPPHLDVNARDLIKRLLMADTTRRLGNLRNGASDLKAHPWFNGLDWDGILATSIAAPIVPKLDNPGDSSHFDEYPEPEPGVFDTRPLDSHVDGLAGPDPYGHLFASF